MSLNEIRDETLSEIKSQLEKIRLLFIVVLVGVSGVFEFIDEIDVFSIEKKKIFSWD